MSNIERNTDESVVAAPAGDREAAGMAARPSTVPTGTALAVQANDRQCRGFSAGMQCMATLGLGV
jgi:hypothetical protein